MSKNTNLSFLTDYITADITNGRIGINNASPTVAFDVSGATKISGVLTLTSTISNGTYAYTLPSATGTLALTSAISGTTNYVPKFTASGTIGNSNLINDASGNLGLGVTPSAWISTAKVLQLNNTASLFAPSSEAILGNNIFVDSTDNNKYITTNFASMYRQVNGQHLFYSAVSGTAGNTISFGTPKLTILSDGNVGIGTSTPTGAAGLALVLNSGASQGRICIKNSGTGDSSGDGLQIGMSGTSAFIEQRENDDLTLSTNASERIRILAAGNVGIGTSSPSTLLHVAGTITGVSNDNYSGDALKLTTKAGPTSYYMNIYPTDAGAGGITWTFAQKVGTTTYDNVMVMRLGNLLIGRTDSGLNNGNGVTLGGGSIQAEANSYIIYGNRTSSDGLFMGIRRNNADVGSITVTTSATAFNTSSDYRLKTDFKDYNGLSLINSIKTYDYAWSIDNTRAYGVKAHELQELLPYMVFGEKDAINEDNSIKPQAVDYSKLVPILIKSIQELSAENTSLINRIEVLENK